jgi:hypothetical protein
MQSKLSKYFKSQSFDGLSVSSCQTNNLSLSSKSVATYSATIDLSSKVFADPKRSKSVTQALQEHFERDSDANKTVKFSSKQAVASGTAAHTPLEKQVIELRHRYSDSLLMVECGYKIRFFGEDARVAAKVLGIYAHYDHNFLVASIPTHRALVHCRRLVQAGHKVA